MSGDISFYGSGLQRAECVLATASGRLYASDQRGGVMVIEPDGRQRLRGTSAMVPNGIALQRDTSLAFGGPDLCTAYMGSLAGDSLAVFRSPVAGLPLAHWNWG